MRVCVIEANNKLIEAQSNDSAPLQTLLDNAVNAGHDLADIKAQVITDAQFETLLNLPINQPVAPTNDEIYDKVMLHEKVLKAFALCINDGTIVPGANITGAALKTAVKSKM